MSEPCAAIRFFITWADGALTPELLAWLNALDLQPEVNGLEMTLRVLIPDVGRKYVVSNRMAEKLSDLPGVEQVVLTRSSYEES